MKIIFPKNLPLNKREKPHRNLLASDKMWFSTGFATSLAVLSGTLWITFRNLDKDLHEMMNNTAFNISDDDV